MTWLLPNGLPELRQAGALLLLRSHAAAGLRLQAMGFPLGLALGTPRDWSIYVYLYMHLHMRICIYIYVYISYIYIVL